jgi:hypothetical protein
MRDHANRVRWIEAGKFMCAFLRKGNLYYVALYNYTTDPNMKFLDEDPK